MQDLIPGRTAWETAEYRKDHGNRAAAALGLRLLGDFVRHDTGPLPPPGTTIPAPVAQGTDEERIAAVDTWAAAHNITAGWSENRHHYGAVLQFGPWIYMVYMIPRDRGQAGKPAPVTPGDAPQLASAA